MNTREKYKSTDFINNKIGKLTITKYSGAKNKKKGITTSIGWLNVIVVIFYI